MLSPEVVSVTLIYHQRRNMLIIWGKKKVSYETGRFKGKGNGRRGEGTGTAFLWFL